MHTLMGDLEHGVGLVRELVDHLETVAPNTRVGEILDALRERPRFLELPGLLVRAHAELAEAMGSLRSSREMLEAQAIDRLRATHGKLSEVNTTAETAAMAIMNGVDQALGLVEQVNAGDDAGRTAQDQLRAVLLDLYNHLQFQDITSQQLQGVGAQLQTVEDRLQVVAGMFDPRAARQEVGAEGDSSDSTALAYNPDAVFQQGGARQADVDATIAAFGNRAPAA
jgi:hypothetical protein